MHLNVDIETLDLWLAFDLIGEGRSLGTGSVAPVPGRARLQLSEIRESATREPAPVLGFVLTFRLGATGSVIGGWLYEAIKGRATSLRIDGVVVPIRRRAIERVLSTRIVQLEHASVIAGTAS